MSKLYSSKEIAVVLNKLGYYYFNQKGSHGKFINEQETIVTLPMNRKELSKGTFSVLLKKINITLNVFEELLSSKNKKA